ncbi:MAG: inositol monophosphatase family protein [Nitrospirota bacterium]
MSTLYDTGAFLETAIQAARRAGEVILRNLGRVSKDDIGQKQASDFVTSVDKESERLIIGTIKERFPDHHILAEESTHEAASGGYRWIVDPLDGTTNFIHQFPVFAVSIALEYKQETITGAVFEPLRGDLYTAEKGKGAYLNGKRIAVSATADPHYSLIATGFPFKRRDLIDPYLILFKNILLKVSDLRRAGSAALDLAYLAAGRCEAFYEIGLSAWDVAAGSLLVAEAGGVVTDFGGGPDYLSTGNIVAGNPGIHPVILEEVRGVFGGSIRR